MENLASMLANHRKEQKEVFQEMKVSMVDSINHLEKTINRMVKVVKDMRYSEERASDGNVQQLSQRCVSVTRSANSTLKRGRAQKVPIKRTCQTSHVGNPRKIRASTFRYGLGFTNHQCDHCGGDGAKGKYPFDRGKLSSSM
ncbi:hypothetical protein Bca52824_062568 [Brassica carinata]|uniref:Uncharacterized protein n=1 Tax=Brassica carinata TaxID=52824 RepID=A0A8X7QDT2_BRACI|nr:hypothetical protein Bca52824_062568 [Brassica carinata]